jgi:hypothetical protein
MTTPQFLEFLDRKFAPYRGKVIPPARVLNEELRAEVTERFRLDITARVLAEAHVDERVAQEVRSCEKAIRIQAQALPESAHQQLEQNPDQHWTVPAQDVAQMIVDGAKLPES